jgi:predicted Zn-ribbon and HTH transcriptional regulator
MVRLNKLIEYLGILKDNPRDKDIQAVVDRSYTHKELLEMYDYIENLKKENKSLQEELYNKSPRCCKCEIFISERSIVCRSCENKEG